MRIRRTLAVATILLTVSALVGGCSGESQKPTPVTSSAPPPDTQIVPVVAEATMRFVPSTVSIHPGKVRIVLTTSDQTAHTFTSTTLGINSGNIPAGKSVTLDFNVPKPGEYPFYCAYHRTQGMTGTIVAKE